MKPANIILLLLTLGITLSCDKDETVAIPLKADYSFVKIEFLNTDESEENEGLAETRKFEFVNRTPIAQSFNYNYPVVFETSRFTGIDTSVINNITDLPLIVVPGDIIENKIYVGVDDKWKISGNTESKESVLNYGLDIKLDPYTKITLNVKLFYREMKTKYRLTLINNNEHKEQTFEGIWFGGQPINFDSDAIYSVI